MAEARRAEAVGDDPVVRAIDQLADVIEENARDERLLARRLRRLRDGRMAGRSWRRLLDNEPEPAALVVVARMLARMSAASGGLRRSLARAVRGEGETVSDIARRFGVTHQRVSTILRTWPGVGEGAAVDGAAVDGATEGGATQSSATESRDREQSVWE
jgi:transposase-like protein